MPRKLKKSEVKKGRRRYPWDEWNAFDGTARVFIHGEDFDCSPRSFAVAAHIAGKKRGIKAIAVVDGKNVQVTASLKKPKTKKK